MPPITLEDGPGGLITEARPGPTAAAQRARPRRDVRHRPSPRCTAPCSGPRRTRWATTACRRRTSTWCACPSWGRASESFGESPVLAGEMGGGRGASRSRRSHVIAVLKHFGPYSQETERRVLNQLVSRARLPRGVHPPVHPRAARAAPAARRGRPRRRDHVLLRQRQLRRRPAGRPSSPSELGSLGRQRARALGPRRQGQPLRAAAERRRPDQADEHRRARGRPGPARHRRRARRRRCSRCSRRSSPTASSNGTVTAAQRPRAVGDQRARRPRRRDRDRGARRGPAEGHEDPPARPLAGSSAVVGDANVRDTCRRPRERARPRARGRPSSCADPHVGLPQYVAVPPRAPAAHARRGAHDDVHRAVERAVRRRRSRRSATPRLEMDGRPVVVSHGLAEFKVQRTALVQLVGGRRYSFHVAWRGPAPLAWLGRASSPRSTRGPSAPPAARRRRSCVAYDLAREGMDRSSLDLPSAQYGGHLGGRGPDADDRRCSPRTGPSTMPWLGHVRGVLEVWNPKGIGADRRARCPSTSRRGRTLLDGARRPERPAARVTFPVSAAQSPMADQAVLARRSTPRSTSTSRRTAVSASARTGTAGGLAGALPLRLRAQLHELPAGRRRGDERRGGLQMSAWRCATPAASRASSRSRSTRTGRTRSTSRGPSSSASAPWRSRGPTRRPASVKHADDHAVPRRAQRVPGTARCGSRRGRTASRRPPTTGDPHSWTTGLDHARRRRRPATRSSAPPSTRLVAGHLPEPDRRDVVSRRGRRAHAPVARDRRVQRELGAARARPHRRRGPRAARGRASPRGTTGATRAARQQLAIADWMVSRCFAELGERRARAALRPRRAGRGARRRAPRGSARRSSRASRARTPRTATGPRATTPSARAARRPRGRGRRRGPRAHLAQLASVPSGPGAKPTA